MPNSNSRGVFRGFAEDWLRSNDLEGVAMSGWRPFGSYNKLFGKPQ